MSANSLVQPLFDGPLDIVGDVHGDLEALHRLMRHLGYDDNGKHQDERRLVFVGDLTDRGPDSPGVVDLVEHSVQSGRAQCVLGNHELNILLEHLKRENKWFFGLETVDKDGRVIPQKMADDATGQRLQAFFRTLPLALEREEVRVVHACWDDEAVDVARGAKDVVAFYVQHHERIENAVSSRDDLDWIDKGLQHQNQNPVKLLTSGPEERTEEPTLSGGRLRNERRVFWWKKYSAAPFCVFGHYSLPYGTSRGHESAFCVDFGVGKRWTQKRVANLNDVPWRLAAIRFPEKLVVFDDGHREKL